MLTKLQVRKDLSAKATADYTTLAVENMYCT